MTTFQQTALLLTLVWLAIVVSRFRRSTIVLIGGLVAIALYTLAALIHGDVTPDQLGLNPPGSWLSTIAFALVWLALMLAYSPVADWLASRWVAQPPTLDSFRAIQESKAKLIAGIMIAWILGGFLEELALRGIVLHSIEAALISPLVAIGAAALCACILHYYQGPRAMIIITQLSILFGILFVISGHNLWAVMLCHGLYDTIAFIRFATRRSRYSNLGTA